MADEFVLDADMVDMVSGYGSCSIIAFVCGGGVGTYRLTGVCRVEDR